MADQLVPGLLNWTQAGPDTAKGIAQAAIRFTREILTQEHEDVADILRQMEAIGLCQAFDAHPAPPVRTRCA